MEYGEKSILKVGAEVVLIVKIIQNFNDFIRSVDDLHKIDINGTDRFHIVE